MIAHIEGILESKIPTHVVIDVNGVGYLLNISLNTYDALPSKGKLRLFSHLIVREDAHILFGFSEEEERMMFRELINVSGVGASTALMVLSSMKPAEVAQAVDQSDVNAFKSVKGIGLKSAQRIIVDLKGKLDKIESNSDFLSSQGNTYKNEALSALVVLGIDKKKSFKYN
jgi:Holliday junction DNA helicase RuvA